MPRPSTGDLASGSSVSPYQAPATGSPLVGPAPLSYAGQPLPPAPAANATPTASGLLNAFKRRWVLGTFVGLLVAVSIGVAVWMLLPGGKHEARGLIDLPDLKMDIAAKHEPDYENYRKNQVFILKTRDLLARTVNDPAVSSLEMIRGSDDPVRLLEENITVAAAAHSIISVTMKGNNLDEMRTIVDALMKRYVDDATSADRRDRTDQTKKYEKLEQELITEIEAQERTIKMLARGSGATGSDAGPDSQGILTARMLELNRKITDITDQITNSESQLKVCEGQLGWFKITDKTLEALKDAGLSDASIEKLKTLKNREFTARRQLSDEIAKLFAKEDLETIRAPIINAAQIPETQHPNIPEGEVAHEINKDYRVMKVQKELDDWETLLKRTIENATDPKSSPEVARVAEKVEQKKRELAEKRQDIRASVVAAIKSRTLLTLQTRVANLEEYIAVAKEARERYKQDHDALIAQRSTSAAGHVEVAQLMKGLTAQQEMLAKVRLSLVSNRVQTQMDSRARIREAAQPLPNNNLNKKLLISGCLGVASFFCVVLLVSFLEWRTRRVDGVDQVVNDLGMRIIGTVPLFPNRASLKVAAEIGGANWRFALNEAINSTRTMLLHTARNQSMQVVMVTSATQGEGKTSVASQLATSMATAGMRTLIVDCDLRNPSVHKLFDLGLTAGVSEILTQDADPTDAIQPTSVPNLWVIPAGQCSNRVVAALAQGHPLETLFNRLRGQFDFVIVDSCPVLPVADALLIGQHVDGVLFSIMQDISQIPKVVLASEKLNQLNIPLLGAVVNGIKQDVYSYGYNYVKQLPA